MRAAFIDHLTLTVRDYEASRRFYRANRLRDKAFCALALRIGFTWGPSYRFRTEVAARGRPAGHAWEGNLFLVGSGDPTLDLWYVCNIVIDGAGNTTVVPVQQFTNGTGQGSLGELFLPPYPPKRGR